MAENKGGWREGEGTVFGWLNAPPSIKLGIKNTEEKRKKIEGICCALLVSIFLIYNDKKQL